MRESILSKKAITANGNKKWLENLQANIIKGHGRDHVQLLLLRFNEGQMEAVRGILASLPITSAWEQLVQTARKNGEAEPKVEEPVGAENVISLYFSAEGYRMLGISPENADKAFQNGLSNRVEKDKLGETYHILGDKPLNWEKSYQEAIHAMLSIANDDLDLLKEKFKELTGKFENAIHIVREEKGIKIKNEYGKPIEHFGYADGISQPLFFQDDIDKTTTAHWDPSAPLSLALVPDFGINESDCFGSYLVFRKLEQNVRAFKKAEEELAHKLGYMGTAEEASGAVIIGRFEPGLPAIKFGSTHSPEVFSEDNDFNYSFDSEGARCPFHAHIRKTNPRGDSRRMFGISDEVERSHRIVRRGITYGDRRFDEDGHIAEDDQPIDGVGLLFIAFQSSIALQFEFMQRSWANNNDFPVPFTGIDPIIGQGSNRISEQPWRKTDGSHCPESLNGFVSMKGGEYFFAPSLVFLRSLDSNSPVV